MKPAYYWEDMKIIEITKGQLALGVRVKSKNGKTYSMGGLPFDFPKKKGDTLKTLINFERMSGYKL